MPKYKVTGPVPEPYRLDYEEGDTFDYDFPEDVEQTLLDAGAIEEVEEEKKTTRSKKT